MSSGLGSRRKAKSSHHLHRCLRSFKRSECSSPTCLSRGDGLKNLFLRHQLSIALKCAPPRLRLCGVDRALLVCMTRIWPGLLGMAQPETILRWHCTGFKAFWRWKSRMRVGRPKIDRELRDLIGRMSKENPLRGASRFGPSRRQPR
jgi:hypothetical protein